MSNDEKNYRIDKFLWFVRVFKTRTLAIESCKKGRIIINDTTVKPSRIVKSGEVINIKKPPVLYSYLVKDFPKSRISPKLVNDYIENVTSPEELHKLDMQDSFFIRRDKGIGRPTKKDRRDINKINGN